MEDALQRLDKLTQEEARMAIAENLKATHNVDERVRGVAKTVVAIDDKVGGIANDVDQVKSLSFHFIMTDYGALHVHHSRGPIAGKHPQMVLPTGSVN
jgi:hypothetical protein